MDANLFLMRQINPSPVLYDRLNELSQLTELQDGTLWVDDNIVRDAEYNEEIVTPEVTVGWGLFDYDGRLHAKYSRLDKAERALAGARVVLPAVEVDVEPDA